MHPVKIFSEYTMPGQPLGQVEVKTFNVPSNIGYRFLHPPAFGVLLSYITCHFALTAALRRNLSLYPYLYHQAIAH